MLHRLLRPLRPAAQLARRARRGRACAAMPPQAAADAGVAAAPPPHAPPQRPKVLVLAGPTASGKTALSLALAHALGGEVISADSVQVYRGLDVGSAKLPLREREGVPHHLLDVLGPEEEMSAGDWADAAAAAAAEVAARGRVPIVVGGTGFYLRWLVSGKPPTPKSDAAASAAARAELAAAAAAAEAAAAGAELGGEALEALRWEAAAAVLARAGDPATARRLARNDYYRLERALEIVRATGQPVAAFAADASAAAQRFDFRCFHLAVPRVVLYRRIDARCEGMLAGGLLREAAALWAAGMRPAAPPPAPHAPPAARSIGYAQALSLLASLRTGGPSAAPQALDACLADMQRASRNYAKRQHTWFRGEAAYRWVDTSDAAGGRDGALAAILESFRAAEHVPCAAAADAPGVGCDGDRVLARQLMMYAPQLTLLNHGSRAREEVLTWLVAWEEAQQRAEGEHAADVAPAGAGAAA